MNEQQIIVIIIVCLSLLWAGIRIYRSYKRIRDNKMTCGCGCEGCALRSAYGQDCGVKQENEEKDEKKSTR